MSFSFRFFPLCLCLSLSLFLPISERLFALTSSTLSGTIFCIPSTICFLTSVLSYLGMFCVLWLHTLVSLSFWLLIYQFSIFRKTVKNLYFYSTLSCLGSSLCSFVILFSLSVSVLVLPLLSLKSHWKTTFSICIWRMCGCALLRSNRHSCLNMCLSNFISVLFSTLKRFLMSTSLSWDQFYKARFALTDCSDLYLFTSVKYDTTLASFYFHNLTKNIVSI